MKLNKIDNALTDILQQLIDKESSIQKEIAKVHKDYKQSALNLYHYLVFRSHDFRKFHDALSDLGLSSLRTGEGYVFNNLANVVRNLRLLQNKPFDQSIINGLDQVGYQRSKKLLKKHANKLFHKARKKHFTEIMVTLPLEAAENYKLIYDMVVNGMEIARINLSHGNFDIWTKMIQNIKTVEEEIGQNIKIYMDLPGPKIRTASISVKSKKGKIKDRIPIKIGEHVILTKRNTKGKKSIFGELGEQIQIAEVGVQLHQIIDDAQIGDMILIDDGMIESKVIGKNNLDLEVIITAARKTKIASRKGINLPNTKLNLPALTNKDIDCLPFICKHADMVGYSFVRTGSDVEKLYVELDKHNARDLGVIFKIENREAFENLPEILFSGMQKNKIGVMIARGDLAVEIGFDRISEVQNQILWLCEAAHVPVIWATQVLESLAKTGMPSRAEISDAAKGTQAECVMLNKGPYINEAITVLKNILVRMEGHTFKKKNELRALNISKKYVNKLHTPKMQSIRIPTMKAS